MYKIIRYFLTALFVMAAVFAVMECSALDIRGEIQEASSGFRTLSTTIVATYSNKSELQKIGKDFARSYEFKEAQVLFKNPNKLKMSRIIPLPAMTAITGT